MKKTLFVLLISFTVIAIPKMIHSQIQQKTNATFTRVGEINRSHVSGAVPEVALEMSVQPANDSTHAFDTVYAIRFDDITYQSPLFSRTESRRYDLYFHNINSALDQFYSILLNVFTDKKYEAKGYTTVITLGTKTVTIRRDFYSDKPKIQVLMDDGMFTIRNTKELNRLFGKPAK